MKLLLIADQTPTLPVPLIEYVRENAIDAVITAGDLYSNSLRGINECGVPAMGVYGNHCDGTYLGTHGMHNLHLNPLTIRGVTFTGIEGCIRYKDSARSIMYTQAEYSQMVAHLTPADVLVTHCPPAGINDHSDLAHTGIDALSAWVVRHRPRLLIHGHTYPTSPMTRYGSTQVAYVRGARIVTFNHGGSTVQTPGYCSQ